MDKSNLELFKQALSEGVSEKFDQIASECTEEIVCSDKHNIAMRTIVYGKAGDKRARHPKLKRTIAIIVAVALLLTSCGVIIFRNEIREKIEEFFVSLTYMSDDKIDSAIENVYKLGYVPEGYSLEKEDVSPVRAHYKYTNKSGDYIWFEQKAIDGTEFYVDNENGYARIDILDNFDVYYRYTGDKHVYVWSDIENSIKLSSSNIISNDELVLIIEGITK